MCRDKCNRCNECNPCDNGCQKVECGCKFEVDAACVRYTKNNLPCTGHPRGALLEDILESIDKKLCEEGEQEGNVVVEAGENITVDVSQDGDTTIYTVNAQAEPEDCNCCNNLHLSLNPTELTEHIVYPEAVVTGGTAPYTYKWTLQQTGGTSFTIGDSTADNFTDVYTSMVPTYGSCDSPQVQGIPCRVSMANGGTDPTHVWHFKLEVTDSEGCTVRDYWTVYNVITD